MGLTLLCPCRPIESLVSQLGIITESERGGSEFVRTGSGNSRKKGGIKFVRRLPLLSSISLPALLLWDSNLLPLHFPQQRTLSADEVTNDFVKHGIITLQLT